MSLQVSINEATVVQFAPPASLPVTSAFFRFNAIGRMLRSTVVVLTLPLVGYPV